jgi:hypothetical protein
MTESPLDNFRLQALYCNALGSPFTASVCTLLAERLPPETRFGRRILNWPGNATHDALALRAAGGLHALSRSGRCPALTAVYPPATVSDEVLWSGIEAALSGHDEFLADYLSSAPQTNEVSRSNAVLGGCLTIAEETGLPLDLYEIGSSAGLNLGFDGYAYELGDARWGRPDARVRIVSSWEGPMPPLTAPLFVRNRQACDLNPLDPSSPDDRERLLSYVWADQLERKQRLEAALAEAAKRGFVAEKADAAEWVERQLSVPGEAGVTRVLFHTIVWQYLPQDTRRRIEAVVAKAGAAATKTAPFAWLRAEPDEVPGSAGIRLTLWPSGEEKLLGRMDFHGRSSHWTERTKS